MAATFMHSPGLPVRQNYSHQPLSQRRHPSRQRFTTELSQHLFDFVIQLLPTSEELSMKEDVRKLLERLIRTIEPDSRLLSFGSTANGFSLRNSDMDLCCLIDSDERLAAADLVTMLGDLLERETKFHVKPLPHARIPIVKLSLDPSPGLPYGIACDIGFENRLALENTRLLMCYAMIDPARVRTLVLFLKVWSKRRKINSPYKGTLSSYGYVLLVIYFLVHVKNPPVLPNLQQIPPLRPISDEETHLNGHNIWFFDDIHLLRQRWRSSNTESVADLLMDFFRYYSRDFAYNTAVASIRAGQLKKDAKGWQNEAEKGTLRERNRLCIEDPFEIDFNVARCVTKDGLYTIRGEFMRALRILAARPERAIVAITQLCEERPEEDLVRAGASPTRPSAPPRLSPLPPQTPYTVGSKPMRPVPVSIPVPENVTQSPNSSATVTPTSGKPIRLPLDQLEHMAPKRGQWTSPPLPEAPEEDHSAFEDRLGQGLALATASTEARENEASYTSSSNNSEVHTDDERHSDFAEFEDAHSTQSFIEDSPPPIPHTANVRTPAFRTPFMGDPSSSRAVPSLRVQTDGGPDHKLLARLRGRQAFRFPQPPVNADISPVPGSSTYPYPNTFVPPPRMDTPRRSLSGPARTSDRFAMSSTAPIPAVSSPLAPNPSPSISQPSPRFTHVFYETSPSHEHHPFVLPAYNSVYSASVSAHTSPNYSPVLNDPAVLQAGPPASSSPHRLLSALPLRRMTNVSGSTFHNVSSTPTPPRSYSPHLHATTNAPAPTPPSLTLNRYPVTLNDLDARARMSPHTTHRPQLLPQSREDRDEPRTAKDFRTVSPYASISSENGSPAMSFASSQYAATSSLSTSPPSPNYSGTTKPPLKSNTRDAGVAPQSRRLSPPTAEQALANAVHAMGLEQ